MSKRRLFSLLMLIVFTVSVIVQSGCSGEETSPEESLEDSSVEDYWPDPTESETESDPETEAETSGEDSMPETGFESQTPVSSGDSPKDTPVAATPTPRPTKSPEESEKDPYPDVPGDSSTRRLPDFAHNLENTTINFLASSVLSDQQKDQLRAFKSLTGQDLKIEVEVVPWANLTNTLAAKVLGNNSPDMFAIGVETTPFLVRQNYFDSVWDYINMNDALWEDVKDVNLMAFGRDGKQYAATPSEPGYTRGIIYNKVLFDDNDLEYPFDLYRKNQWTWDAMFDAAREINVDSSHDGELEVRGLSAPDFTFGMIVSSTGTDFVKYGPDGEIVNNLQDSLIQRAADFTYKIGTELTYDEENWMWVNRFAQNRIGMVVGHPWEMISGPVLDMKKAGNVGWAPFPRDPQADEYYHQGQTFFYFMPKNGGNHEGVAAWLYFQRYMDLNPSPVFERNRKELALETWGWTEEEYYFIYEEIYDDLIPVFAVGERVPDFDRQAYLWGMPFTHRWSATVEEVNPSFQASIDAFNSR